MEKKKLQKYRSVQGIYALIQNSKIVYIGYSKNVYIRSLEHIADGKIVFNDLKCMPYVNREEGLIYEMALISIAKPIHNKIKFDNFIHWLYSLPFNTSKYDPYEILNNCKRYVSILEDIIGAENDA